MSLKSKIAVQFAIVTPLFAVVMFLPAGTFVFWQGWVFLAVVTALNMFLALYFYKRDPRLLERRMQRKEPTHEQQVFKRLWIPLWVVTLLLPGLDHRFGWSREWFGGVPLWLTLLSLALVAFSSVLVFEVLKANSFASAVVQVEAGQRVISDGPYRWVRHPMYSAFAVMILFAPPALGSYVALPVAVLLIPVLVLRLTAEERLLRRDLPGYAEYCARTRYRLVPHLY